jgi:hypothetical protein
LLLCQELYNLKMGSGRHLSASSYWQDSDDCKSINKH